MADCGKVTIFAYGENRLRLNNSQINLVLYSACTIFAYDEDRLRLNNSQINLVLYSACTIFASVKAAPIQVSRDCHFI